MLASDRRNFLFGSGAAALLAGAPPAFAQSGPGPRLPESLERELAAELEAAQIVGAAITVVQAGEVRAFMPFGRASVPFDRPVTPSTLFHTGSVGKHVTALAILQLVEAGQLSLDAPIGGVVPGLADWIAAIPIRHLLGHTSGVPEYTTDTFEWDRPMSRQSILAALERPDFAPGETWSYSNTAYVLLGYAIEAVSGVGYADYVNQRLFQVAGLPRARADTAGDAIVERAEPYDVVDGRVRHAVRMEDGVSSAPDGGLLMSGQDWAPWERAIGGGRLVGPAMRQAIFTHGTLNDGVASGYGLGWFIDEVRGRPVHYHSGGVPGFITLARYHPAEQLMAVATFNSPPQRPVRNLLERAIETVVPGVTTIGLTAQSQSEARDTRLRAFLAGGTDEDLVLPSLLLGERVSGREPARRLSGPLESAEFLESHAVTGGQLARYRLTVGGVPLLRQIGWTPDDRIFLFR